MREALEQPSELELELRVRIELAHTTFELDPATGVAALELARESIPVLEQLGSRRALARAWILVAVIEGWRCDAAAWQAAMEEALTHYRGTQWSPCFVYDQIGSALYYGPAPAREGVARCRTLLEKAPDQASVATLTRWYAALEAIGGRHEQARSLLDDVDKIEAALPAGALPGETIVVRIELERLAGRMTEAEQLLRESCVHHERRREWPLLSTRAADLAMILVSRGALLEAAEQLERAQTLAEPEDVLTQILCRRALANLQTSHGNDQDASSTAHEAYELAAPTDFIADRAWLLLDLAVIESRRTGVRPAAAVDEALALFEQKQHYAGIAAARAAALSPSAA